MNIIDIDEKNGIIELQVENVNDLFVLSNFIRPGDLLEANTTRKVKFESGESERIKMRLVIEVERIGFHEFQEALRVTGRIVSGPEKYVSIGSYHTIQIKPHMKIKVKKKEGLIQADMKILKEADLLSKINPIILVAIERDEATVAVLYSSGLRVVRSIYQNIAYKGSNQEKALKNAFFKTITDVILEVIRNTERIAGIIIAGPGIIKNEFANYLAKTVRIDVQIVVDQASSGTESGIYEILRRGSALKITENMLIAKDVQDYEEFLMHLGKGDGLVAYGLDAVEKAVEWGAARKVLVNIEIINNPDNEIRGRALIILEKADSIKCPVRIISRSHPLHDKIKNFGGIIALLRFKIGVE